jgi:hypothetical protein
MEHQRQVQGWRRAIRQIHVRPSTSSLPFAISLHTNLLFFRFEDGSRSPYTLSHLSVDGRFLLTWGPQRGLQLVDLDLRAVTFTVPAADTGVLEAVFCGAQSPAHAAAAGASPLIICSMPMCRCLFTTSLSGLLQALCHFKL